jgi:imidazolonepropionase-like amidohydrolase
MTPSSTSFRHGTEILVRNCHAEEGAVMVDRIAVRAERVFDGERLLPHGGLVLVDGGRIVAVEPASTPVPDGRRLIECPGGTLLPGLVDAHVHLCCDSGDGALDRLADHDDATQAQVIETALRRELAAGVTAVRDLGDRNYATLAWRRRPGLPAVAVSGPPITSPRGHCWNMGGEVAGPTELAAAVAERAERGVDVVKVMASGGIHTSGTDVEARQFSDEDLRLLVTLAHDAGLPVTAHAHPVAAVEQALDAGVDGIEHCTCITADGVRTPDALLDRLAASGIPVCPTIGLLPDLELPPRIRAIFERYGLSTEARAAHAATLHRAGVRIVSGGDSGINHGKPHGILPWSIIALIDAGVPATAALASATSLAATAIGFGTHKGRIRPDYDADLLLVHGNPLTDPHALRNPAAVLLNGHLAQEPGRDWSGTSG